MKKSLQKSLALIMAVLMVFGAGPIMGVGMLTMAAGDLLSISVLPDTLELKEGASYQLRVGGRTAGGSAIALDDSKVTWSSSDDTKAKVSSDGFVELQSAAKAGDTVTIYAFYNDGNAAYPSHCVITVVADSITEVKSIGIVPDAVTLKVGQRFALSAFGYAQEDKKGSAMPLTNVTWKSKNTVYATVDDQGVVTAVKTTKVTVDGEEINNGVEIEASYQKSGSSVLTSTIKVYIDDEESILKSITIVPGSVTDLVEGNTLQLQAVGHGTDGKEYPLIASQLSWTSSDTSFVEVSGKGVITAKQPTGERNDIFVYAYYTVNGKTYPAACNIRILKKEPVAKKLVVAPANHVMGVSDTVQMQATGLDSDGNLVALDGSRLSWSSGDSTVLLTSTSGLVSALKTSAAEGVKIYAYYRNSDGSVVSGEGTIIVRQRVDEIRWKWDANALVAGHTYSFKDRYEVFPSTAENKDVILTCSDPTMLEIDNTNQTFTVNHYPGSAESISITITLTAKDPSSQCKPVSKQMTVFNKVPLYAIHWKLNVNSQNIAQFSFYENQAKEREGVAARYWYGMTDTNGLGRNKYETEPTYAAGLCDITVTSSNERVMKVDKATKSLIPVGNGECILTITAKSETGTVVSDTVTVRVVGSHYTPITAVAIGINTKQSSESNYEVLSSSSIRLAYTKSMVLGTMLPPDDKTAKGTFDHETFDLTLEDGRVITVYEAANIKWESSNTSAVKVDKNGKIEAVGPGTAKITATVIDNDAKPMQASISVTVRISLLQAIAGVFMSLVKLNFKTLWEYLKAVFVNLFGSVGKFFG